MSGAGASGAMRSRDGNPFERAACGWHWVTRHPGGDGMPGLYEKRWNDRFYDERWWPVGEGDDGDADWTEEEMGDEGWRYGRPATAAESAAAVRGESPRMEDAPDGGAGGARRDGLAHNTRYAAYARAHGRDAEAQAAADRERWPGGCMAGFVLWNGARIAEFGRASPGSFMDRHLMDHAAYDEWLAALPPGHAAG